MNSTQPEDQYTCASSNNIKALRMSFEGDHTPLNHLINHKKSPSLSKRLSTPPNMLYNSTSPTYSGSPPRQFSETYSPGRSPSNGSLFNGSLTTQKRVSVSSLHSNSSSNLFLGAPSPPVNSSLINNNHSSPQLGGGPSPATNKRHSRQLSLLELSKSMEHLPDLVHPLERVPSKADLIPASRKKKSLTPLDNCTMYADIPMDLSLRSASCVNLNSDGGIGTYEPLPALNPVVSGKKKLSRSSDRLLDALDGEDVDFGDDENGIDLDHPFKRWSKLGPIGSQNNSSSSLSVNLRRQSSTSEPELPSPESLRPPVKQNSVPTPTPTPPSGSPSTRRKSSSAGRHRKSNSLTIDTSFLSNIEEASNDPSPSSRRSIDRSSPMPAGHSPLSHSHSPAPSHVLSLNDNSPEKNNENDATHQHGEGHVFNNMGDSLMTDEKKSITRKISSTSITVSDFD